MIPALVEAAKSIKSAAVRRTEAFRSLKCENNGKADDRNEDHIKGWLCKGIQQCHECL